MSFDAEALSEVSAKQVLKKRKRSQSIVRKSVKDLRSLGMTKRINSQPPDRRFFTVSQRHAYLTRSYSSLLLCLLGWSSHDFRQSNNEKILPVVQKRIMKLFDVDNYQRNLRGRWLTTKELFALAGDISDDRSDVVLVDGSLIVSRRSMPLTRDREVVRFFNECMSPSEDLWKRVVKDKSPIIIGVTDSITSKITNAMLSQDSVTTLETFPPHLVERIAGLKTESPWVGESMLLYHLLEPAERTVMYKLSERNLVGVPVNLMKEGVVNTYVMSPSRSIFRVEIPSIYIEDNDGFAHELVSNLLWLCEFMSSPIPRPVAEARSYMGEVKMRRAVRDFSALLLALEREIGVE